MRKHPNSHREAKATAPVLDSTSLRIGRSGSMSVMGVFRQLTLDGPRMVKRRGPDTLRNHSLLNSSSRATSLPCRTTVRLSVPRNDALAPSEFPK